MFEETYATFLIQMNFLFLVLCMTIHRKIVGITYFFFRFFYQAKKIKKIIEYLSIKKLFKINFNSK